MAFNRKRMKNWLLAGVTSLGLIVGAYGSAAADFAGAPTDPGKRDQRDQRANGYQHMPNAYRPAGHRNAGGYGGGNGDALLGALALGLGAVILGAVIADNDDDHSYRNNHNNHYQNNYMPPRHHYRNGPGGGGHRFHRPRHWRNHHNRWRHNRPHRW